MFAAALLCRSSDVSEPTSAWAIPRHRPQLALQPLRGRAVAVVGKEGLHLQTAAIFSGSSFKSPQKKHTVNSLSLTHTHTPSILASDLGGRDGRDGRGKTSSAAAQRDERFPSRSSACAAALPQPHR